MKRTVRRKAYRDVEVDLNPLCPKCDRIVAHGGDEYIPRYCPECGYDLSRGISPIRKFFHARFWGIGDSAHIVKYQLAQYDPMQELIANCKKRCK